MAKLFSAVVVITLLLCGIIFWDAISSNADRSSVPSAEAKLTEPQKTIAEQDQGVFESYGIQSCRVKPLQSYTSQQREVIANGRNYIIYCNPNYNELNYCCYLE